MAYLDINTLKYPLHEGDIRLSHPAIGEDFVLPEGYVEIEYVSHPEFDPELEYVTEDKPLLIDGVWTMQWIINKLSEEDIANRLIDAAMREEHEKARLELLNLEGSEPDVIG